MGTPCSRHCKPAVPPPAASRPARPEICPPQRQHAPQHWLGRVKNWLVTGWPGTSTPASIPPERSLALTAACQGFLRRRGRSELPAAAALLDRIEYAKSMRELWHLRAEVFALVSLGSASSGSRPAPRVTLNRHFPTRAPRSASSA